MPRRSGPSTCSVEIYMEYVLQGAAAAKHAGVRAHGAADGDPVGGAGTACHGGAASRWLHGCPASKGANLALGLSMLPLKAPVHLQ